jgi:hypothetical protein
MRPPASCRVALLHRLQRLLREVKVWPLLHTDLPLGGNDVEVRDYPGRDVLKDVVHVLDGVHPGPVCDAKSPLKLFRVIALKFCLFKETSFVPGQWLRLPALTVVTTGLWSVVLSGITFDSEMSPLV